MNQILFLKTVYKTLEKLEVSGSSNIEVLYSLFSVILKQISELEKLEKEKNSGK